MSSMELQVSTQMDSYLTIYTRRIFRKWTLVNDTSYKSSSSSNPIYYIYYVIPYHKPTNERYYGQSYSIYTDGFE